MKVFKNKSIDIGQFEEGILSGDRIILAKAITLIESSLIADQHQAEELIEKLLPKTGNSIRLGITGVPGVGKSTFIETLGLYLTSLKKKIAVLAVDPSSIKTKGSILGDKTRMDELAKHPLAFIRPSSTGGSLGGVAHATREVILLCEAAGFDVIIIETVGVGQSEITVREMTDFFLLLILAGGGDELQGIKKGIMEMADGFVITKVDSENVKPALIAQANYQQALHLFNPSESGWMPEVLTTSAFTKKGIPEVWTMIQKFESVTKATGFFDEQRTQQDIFSFHHGVDEAVRNFVTDKSKNLLTALEQKVKSKQLSPRIAARMVLTKIQEMKS
ncbi:MAG: methylmalonyl Co-A mutase-associated GTPase MeaB [Bacteroidia bacterium]|nr:methylmalonyl Co-A mutase-associated GTPase MeaB [Bacteroidia bacterium]